jgi:hypothetical protein
MRLLLWLETFLISVAGLAFAVVVLEAPGFFDLSQTAQVMLLSGALAALCLGVFLLDRGNPDSSLFNPLTTMLILFVGFYVLPAIYATVTENNLYYRLTRLEDNLPRVIAIVFLGAVTFLVGYSNFLTARMGRKARLFAFAMDDTAVKRLWWLAFAAAWVARAALFAGGIYLQGGSSQSATPVYISLFGGFLFLAQFSLCLSFDRYLDLRAKGATRGITFWKYAFFAGLILEYVYALPTGSKGGILIPAVLLLGIAVLRGRRYSLARVAVAAALVVGAYYIFLPVSNAYREATYHVGLGWSRQVSVSGIIELMGETYERLASADREVYWRDAEARAISRVTYPAMLNEVLRYLDRGGEPLQGWSYVIAFLAPIPRAIWPDKPSIALGRFYGGLFGGDEITSYAISTLGEVYINFLLPGVIIGMLLYGVAYRWIWNMFVEHLPRSCVSRSVYMVVWLQVFAIGTSSNFAAMFGGLLKMFLILGVMMIVARTRGSRWSSAASQSPSAVGG